jgi:hypothetical protein
MRMALGFITAREKEGVYVAPTGSDFLIASMASPEILETYPLFAIIGRQTGLQRIVE